MIKFTACLSLVALRASASYSFDTSRSIEAVKRMRALSASIYKHEQEGASLDGASNDVINAFEDLNSYIDDIPGAGFVIQHIPWPGDDDTKAIMQALDEIKYELDQMRLEMQQAWKDIMTEAELIACWTDISPHEEDVFSAWRDFKAWYDALNNENLPEAESTAYKGTFLTDCEDNKCKSASEWMLNGLYPNNDVSPGCNVLKETYNSSGIQGYMGYRDYIATKNGVMFLEAQIAIIMQTINLIETYEELTPEQALDMQVNIFGSWSVDAATRIADYVQKCYDEAESTRPVNETTAKNRIQGSTTDKQQTANQLHSTLKSIYSWNNWAVAVTDYSSNYCMHEYRCDNAVSCSEDHSRNHHWTVIIQVDGSTKAPISSFVNQQRWDWWPQVGQCPTETRDQIAEAGCGGGSVVTRTNRDPKFAYDRDEMWINVADYDTIFSWADHDCQCNWPDDCEGRKMAEFLQ